MLPLLEWYVFFYILYLPLLKQSHVILFVGLHSFTEHEINLFYRLTKAGYGNRLLFFRTPSYIVSEGYRYVLHEVKDRRMLKERVLWLK